MGIFDTIVESISGGKKIYRSQIEKIPGSRFARSVKIKIGDEAKRLDRENLRDKLSDMVAGGVSLKQLEKKLKKAGLEGEQYERRKEIIEIIKNNLDK